MSARFTLSLALLLLGASRSVLLADSGTPPFSPEKYDISRYQKIWERSPFIVETKAVVQSSPLASKYALVGLVQSGNESVAFLDDSGKTVMISKKHPDRERNLELVAIMADKDFRKSKVTIKQGNEQADLPFDPRGVVAMGGSASLEGAPQRGAVPPAPVGVINSPYIPPPPSGNASPGQRMPVPTTRRIISPGGVQPEQAAAGAAPSTVIPPPNANSTGALVPPTPTHRIIRPKPIDASTY